MYRYHSTAGLPRLFRAIAIFNEYGDCHFSTLNKPVETEYGIVFINSNGIIETTCEINLPCKSGE